MTEIPFMVYNRPYYLVGKDLIETNLLFLDNFQPNYFYETSKLMFEIIKDSDNKDHNNYLASQIKILYSQALETFFAFLFASVQAPLCTIGWMQKYWSKQLIKLIQVINTHVEFDYFKVSLESNTWYNISKKINNFELEDRDLFDKIIKGYSKFWDTLAMEFIKENINLEYNHIKHGFRIKPGGFDLKFKKDRENGDKYISIGSSEYGANLYQPIDIEFDGKKTNVFYLKRSSFNWDLEFYVKRLKLLTYSISNIISFNIGLIKGDFRNQIFSYPDDITMFEETLFDKLPVRKFEIEYGVDNINKDNYKDERVKEYYKEKITI
ncbi:MAG: hypothetical protein P9L97_04090 [Candidatus Tenebribacter davisii]|nr:hypothetical protein [Candidatus Tenebribacter davisii]